jgi:hypothetical protein
MSFERIWSLLKTGKTHRRATISRLIEHSYSNTRTWWAGKVSKADVESGALYLLVKRRVKVFEKKRNSFFMNLSDDCHNDKEAAVTKSSRRLPASAVGLLNGGLDDGQAKELLFRDSLPILSC